MDPIERLCFLVPGTGAREGVEKTQPFNGFPSHRVIGGNCIILIGHNIKPWIIEHAYVPLSDYKLQLLKTSTYFYIYSAILYGIKSASHIT